MIQKLLRYSIALTLVTFVLQLTAQNEIAHIYGQLKDQTTKKKLEGCLVQVFKDGAVYDNFDAGSSGKYDFKLPLGFTYDIKFSKSDYLAKIIRIDTRNIPEEERYGGFDMNVDGTLFPYREGFNTDLLKDPLARAAYNPQGDGLEFEFDYSEKKAKEIAAEFKRLDDIEKNFEKLKEDFDKLVREGDQNMIEKKYSDAVNNYKGALAIFPKEEPVKVKLEDAQAKLDAEEAAKGMEAKYKKLVEEGDKTFKDKKYVDSKKKFEEATKLKPAEKYPKEMLYQIEQAMADSEQRKQYDDIVADADKKYQNKDYAVCIERYKEASKIYPTESYPKDQILKAEAALKDMLASEADKLRIQRDYDDKISLAERSVGEDKLEQAIGHYRAASGIKPEEQMPKDKIIELEALIAERKAQQDLDSANALANAERDRIEKEYNDLVAAADELFKNEELLEAKSKYEGALGVKPDALYPKSKIETIEMLLAQKEEMASMGVAKALQDSLDAANLAAQMAADERMKQQLDQERLDAERRQEELEAERLAAEEKLRARKHNWVSNVDEEAEDEVENYYRQAAEKEYKAKSDSVNQMKDEFISFYSRKSKDSDALTNLNREHIKDQKENQLELASIGESIQSASIADNERKKKNTNKDNTEYERRAETRRLETESNIEKKKEALESVEQNDRNRKSRIIENNDRKEQAAKNNEAYSRKGDVLRTENKMKTDREKEEQQELSFDGETVRKENEEKVESRIHDEAVRDKDTRKAADQRIVNSSIRIDNTKANADALDEGKDINANKNANEVAMKKKDIEFQEKQRESASANERFEARKDAFNKKSGEPKGEEEYLEVPGTEHLKEGVTENSYKLGNKMVTERTVKVGNKVDKYKKVVSKTAIYYFRNGQSITETTWKRATLLEYE